MAVLAFVRPEPGSVAEPAGVCGRPGGCAPASRLRPLSRALRLCFILVLTFWAALQTGCLLSLFLRFRCVIVAGTIHGTLAFRFWPAIDYFSPDHASSGAFVPHDFPLAAGVGYALIVLVASAPFCSSLLCLIGLFGLYARGEIFTRRTATAMRRIGHSLMATGYAPLPLGPLAHALGMLKPITGVTDAMIAFLLTGLMLLALSHVMEMGERLRQDQEDIL